MANESVFDRQENEDYKVPLIDLGDGTFARTFLSVPGHNVDVLLNDQHSDSFDAYLGIQQQTGITLTADASEGDRVVSVSASHGFVAGSYLALSKPSRVYIGYVVSVNVNDITLDRLIPEDFLAVETSIIRGTDQLNVTGTAGSPITAWMSALGYSGKFDLTNIVIAMTSTNLPAWDNYGDLATLTYGCTLRVVYDKGMPTQRIVNLCNIKSNSHLAQMSDSLEIFDETKPFGVNGLIARLGFGGQEKRGVVIRLGGTDELEYVIQDDLSTLLEHRVMVRGHVVVD